MNENIKLYAEKFKLTNEQLMVYTWLKEQQINTDDNTLCYWVKTYSSTRIKEVVEFANARRVSGQKILNMGGWIHKFLKNGNAVVNETCKFNQDYAIKFARDRNWEEVSIYEKYIKDNVTSDDLPLTMQTQEFIRLIEKLYQKSQLYK